MSEQQEFFDSRINELPEWARDYIHHVHTFMGAPEVEELTQLRDQREQLIAAIAELKQERDAIRAETAARCAEIAHVNRYNHRGSDEIKREFGLPQSAHAVKPEGGDDH